MEEEQSEIYLKALLPELIYSKNCCKCGSNNVSSFYGGSNNFYTICNACNNIWRNKDE